MDLLREGGEDTYAEKSQPIHAAQNDVAATNHVEEENVCPQNGASESHGNSDFKNEVMNPKQERNVTAQGMIQQPHWQLPKPEAPPGVTGTDSPANLSPNMERSVSAPGDFDMPAIGKFILDKSNSFSAAITQRLSSLREGRNDNDVNEEAIVKPAPHVVEFNLAGLKVIKSLKELGKTELKGRISFFSRSNCRDCTAVRSFFREKNLYFVEINIDVFPTREKELIERTASGMVPKIFFNEKLIGGLVALNSLRNSGMLGKKMEEMLGSKCPDDAPAPPVYGFDDAEEESLDEMVAIVKVLRQKLPIQDRLTRMKIVKNCFTGSDLVEVIIHHLDCGRKKAVEIGRQLARKHFIHHVFGDNDFEDGNHFYRFLEHEPFITKCYNFRGSVNDSEPTNASILSQRLARIMSAILESYASDERHHLDYIGIKNSEELRRYINLVQDLQRINILTLSADEKLAFFLNLHNAMAIHAVIRIGHPGGMIDRRAFFDDFMYIVGGYPYSLNTIRNGILRSNKRAPFSITRPFGSGDKRLELAVPKVNLLIHFGLCNATRSSPTVRLFTAQGVASELRYAAREFFERDDGMRIDLAKRTMYLSRVIKWYIADFGQEKEIPKWIINYLDATKAGLLTHLLNDGGPINIVYQNFDWSLNF